MGIKALRIKGNEKNFCGEFAESDVFQDAVLPLLCIIDWGYEPMAETVNFLDNQ